jgi:hypothetical protein
LESQIHKMCPQPPQKIKKRKKRKTHNITKKISENAMKFNISNIKIKLKNLIFISLEIIYVNMDLIN